MSEILHLFLPPARPPRSNSFRRWCSQMLPPPQSLHVLLCRWCSQRPLPPQSLHLLLLCRWCSQMLIPPQSLQLLLRRWCLQKLLMTGALRGFLAAEGCRARVVARPDASAGSTGPPEACPSSILFFPAAAASRPSVWSDILLCGVSSTGEAFCALGVMWRLSVHSV